MSELYSDSIFWVEVEKIRPNPYQPRRHFDDNKLRDLSESIRQYGVLQPLVVTRHEVTKSDGGIVVEYELIAGERRLRASKLAKVSQVPVIIRAGEDNSKMKLELAIIENLQREDLNPVDRARAFLKFIDEFGLKHVEIAKKVGKSREYVSNSIRLLSLPQNMLDALAAEKISEGHARALMMLKDRPEQQLTIFKEVMFKKLTVRETEGIARRIAKDKVRKKMRVYDPEIVRMEEELTEKLGTRVQIESREVGGKITIDFFSDDDLRKLLEYINENKGVQNEKPSDLMQKIEASTPIISTVNNTPEPAIIQTNSITEEISTNTVADENNFEEIDIEVPKKIVSPKPIASEEIGQEEVIASDSLYSRNTESTSGYIEPFTRPTQKTKNNEDDIIEDAPQNTYDSAVTEENVNNLSDNRESTDEYNSEPQDDSFDVLIEGDNDTNTDISDDENQTKKESGNDTDMYSVHNFSI